MDETFVDPKPMTLEEKLEWSKQQTEALLQREQEAQKNLDKALATQERIAVALEKITETLHSIDINGVGR